MGKRLSALLPPGPGRATTMHLAWRLRGVEQQQIPSCGVGGRRRSSAEPTTLGAKRRVSEPLERSGGVPLFADEGVVGEGFPKLLVNRLAWPVRRDDASGDHVVARAVGLRAVVLRVRAVVARKVALQGLKRVAGTAGLDGW